MIYDTVVPAADIRQGDIFVRVPRIEMSLERVLTIGEHDDEELTWEELLERGENTVTMAVAARPVMAIVITQDCDTLRAPSISLCEIRRLEDVVGSLGASTSKIVKNIPKQTRANLKWFYMPPAPNLGIEERMAVDFQVTLSVPRKDLERLRSLRIGRLNPEADEHFRERLAEFYRRYPVDEWYAFSREEFEEYRRDYPTAQARPYQV